MISPFRKQQRDYNAAYTLTPMGKQKADDAMASGPIYDVLNYLSEHSVSTVSEISQEKGYPAKNIEHFMRKLEKQGYVTRVDKGEDI